MEITFDPDKDSANLEKHGVSLAAAADLDWENAIDWEDTGQDYQETRIGALAPIGQSTMLCTWIVSRLTDGSGRRSD